MGTKFEGHFQNVKLIYKTGISGYIRAIYISDIVIQEISKCNEKKLRILLDYLGQINYNIIETEQNIVELAKTFIEAGILRQKSFEDCLHIAAAILAGCDIITSWDFKHIVNKKQ